jgi:thiamine kinase-like enzyme
VDAGYVDGLRRLAARLERAGVVLTAAHNDLTMANVWLSDGRIGVLDWETAAGDGLPLSDLWYALADALARARRTPHDHALAALVHAGGTVPAALVHAPRKHAAGLSLTPDQALLGFHACWLGHAATELRRGTPGRFVAVVARVAAERLLWPAGEDRAPR